MSDLGAVSLSEINDTFGVLLLGLIFTVTLYGLTFFQTYFYYSRFSSDSIWSKCSVGMIWAMDTATTALSYYLFLVSQTLYNYMITNFVVPFNQLDMTKSFVAESGISSFGIFAVHTFYAVRIWKVNDRNPIIPGLVLFFSVAGFATGLVGTALISMRPLFYNFVAGEVEIASIVQYGIYTACDLIILISLFCSNGIIVMKAPQNAYEYIVVNFLIRGTCFTVLQIVCLVTFIAKPTHQVWIFFHFITSKVYANSLMAMLNFRDAYRGRGVTDVHSAQFTSKANGTLTGHGPAISHEMQLNMANSDGKPSALMTMEPS
ncbi:hypothetical protein BKA93DRAFT_827817 [Sparassis latifolia]